MNNPSILPKGILGHLYDIYLLCTFRFRNPHSYTKYRLIKSIKNMSNAENLIEVGTYKGITTKRCSKIFKKVYTIELDHELFMSSRKYLENADNVTSIEGDAKNALPELLVKTEPDTLVFLDGHFSGSDTAIGDEPEPALFLIDCLADHIDKLSAVVIDDFREFGYKGWPKKSELLQKLEDCFVEREFEILIHLDMVAVARTSK